MKAADETGQLIAFGRAFISNVSMHNIQALHPGDLIPRIGVVSLIYLSAS